MSTRILFAASALILAGCATPQENPIYQYSSVYDQKQTGMTPQDVAYRDNTAPHTAPHSTPLAAPVSAPASAPVYSRVTSDCITLGTCAPVGVAEAIAPTISQPWASPTEEQFAGGASTPGFRALEGSLSGDGSPYAPAPSYAADATPDPLFDTPVPTPRPIEDIPTLTISGPIHAAESLTGTQSHALMHRVEEGDTVYSLARDYCADVEAIRVMNRLNAAYAITPGQDLKLPANCQ